MDPSCDSKHGRTECIRSVTAFSAEIVNALAPRLAAISPTADAAATARQVVGSLGTAEVARLSALVAKALAAQRAVARSCQRGEGHERHLRALMDVATQQGSGTPALYEDGGWARVCSSVLSTSGLRADALSLFCFGPVVSHGVGFGAQTRAVNTIPPHCECNPPAL